MTKTKIKSVLFAFLVILGLVFISSTSFAEVAEKGASAGCKTLASRHEELRACILCPLFKVILITDQSIATKAFDALSGGFRNVIVMVLGLVIAYHTLILVSSFTKQDTPKYIGTLLLQTFKVLVAVLLLTNHKYIYDYLINPLMLAGLEFGIALLFNDVGQSVGGVDIVSQFENEAKASAGSMPQGAIGQQLLGSVYAAVKMFSEAAAQLPAIGGSLICISVNEGTKFIINLEMFIQGAVIYVFGWAITLACCFYLLDSVVRFGIFCALLPFFIASWPFKITFKYTKTGTDIFMNAFFNFAMIGLVISLATELLVQAVSGEDGGFDELINAINNPDDVEPLRKMMDITGMKFLVLIACGLFAFKLVEQINQLATQLAGGGGSQGIGNKIGGVAAQAAKKVAGVAASGGKAVGGAAYELSGAKAKVEGIKSRTKAGISSGLAKIGIGNKAMPSSAGSGGGGSGGGSSGSFSSSGGSGGGGGSGGSGGGSGGGDDSGGGGGGSGGSGGGNEVARNENGNVVLPNGQEVNGLGVATRNSDGGVTFTSQGADGSRNIKSYDKDGNAHMSSFDKDGNKTSDYTINKDGSSKGFIKQDDGSIQQWDEKAGERKNEDNIF